MSALSQLGNLVSLVSRPRRRGRPSSQGSLIGSQDQILPAGRPRTQTLRQLDIPELPLRPILFSYEASRSLLEMSTWSLEFATCLRILSQNVFQDEDGSVHSWKLKLDQDNPENNPDSYVRGLVEDFKNRYHGRDEVLGGQILEPAVRSMCGLGDSYMELGIERDGSGYSIARSMYLPSLSIFVDEDEHGGIQHYRQQIRVNPGEDDIIWPGVHQARILHFKSPNTGRYGLVPGLPQIDSWEDIKNSTADVADAARGASILPNVHTMPPDKGENYKNSYREDYESRQREGIIMDLFLGNGAKIEKLAAATPTLKPLLDHHLQLRYKMMFPGVPVFLIPGLGLEQGASKELGAAPALAYGKLINTIRSYLAKQIIWAIGVEVTLNRGYEYWLTQRPKVELEWPNFITQEVPGLNPSPQDEETAQETFINVNGKTAKTLIR
ncbi:hypothetical protein Lepto7375DRAFT_7286 [Leptolyngbya sp. PCC 7375]|nr:hypothetical protein Lepto7375DRAFT_7286 [Leptolyngbya sp. PCC 7375]